MSTRVISRLSIKAEKKYNTTIIVQHQRTDVHGQSRLFLFCTKIIFKTLNCHHAPKETESAEIRKE